MNRTYSGLFEVPGYIVTNTILKGSGLGGAPCRFHLTLAECGRSYKYGKDLDSLKTFKYL